MLVGACGMACGACTLYEKKCKGCNSGKNAKPTLELMKELGHICKVLECAYKNGVDYCFRCTKFPCDLHYGEKGPYKIVLLDELKEELERLWKSGNLK